MEEDERWWEEGGLWPMFRRLSLSDHGDFWASLGELGREEEKGWKGGEGADGDGDPGITLAEGSRGRSSWESLGKACRSCGKKQTKQQQPDHPKDTSTFFS